VRLYLRKRLFVLKTYLVAVAIIAARQRREQDTMGGGDGVHLPLLLLLLVKVGEALVGDEGGAASNGGNGRNCARQGKRSLVLNHCYVVLLLLVGYSVESSRKYIMGEFAQSYFPKASYSVAGWKSMSWMGRCQSCSPVNNNNEPTTKCPMRILWTMRRFDQLRMDPK